MICQTGRHGRRPPLPLPLCSRPCRHPETIVFPTPVVSTAHQVHACLHTPLLMQQCPAPAHQSRQIGAEGGIEPLDGGCVDPQTCPGACQDVGDGTATATHHAPHHLDQPAAAVTLDQLTDEQPRFDHQPRPT